jgi:anti-sigma B factor antagonist
VAGEIDVATAPQLRESLHRVIARGEATIVLDLLDVSFLDSTALGVLVGALKRCRELGGDLHVVVTDPRIMKIFEITGLTKVFPIADSLAAVGAS